MNAIGSKLAKKSMLKSTSAATSKKASKSGSDDTQLHGTARLKSTAGKLIKSLVGAITPKHPTGKPAATQVSKPLKPIKLETTVAAAKAKATIGKLASKPVKKITAETSANPTGMSTIGAAGLKSGSSSKAGSSKTTRNVPATSQPKTAKAASQASQSGARLIRNKAGVEIMGQTEPIVVLKASEVATKNSKPTSADTGILSEAQVLKMNEKDYMNAAQRTFFKARLQQLERDLLKNADETTEHLRETVLVPDPADRATIEEEHALELRTRDRERKLLKKIQQSIASIDSGDYGWCEETGEPIGVPRLLARPTATLSLEAQQRRELKQKLYGD